MSRVSLICVVGLFVVGCVSTPPQNVQLENSAKVRVFHGTAVDLYPGKTCYELGSPERIEAATGYSVLSRNVKVGMPLTDDIPYSYGEFVVPSSIPLTIMMDFALYDGKAIKSCGPLGATFTPETGKYYDTSMLLASGKCSIQLRELTESSPGNAVAKIKATTPAFACVKLTPQSTRTLRD